MIALRGLEPVRISTLLIQEPTISIDRTLRDDRSFVCAMADGSAEVEQTQSISHCGVANLGRRSDPAVDMISVPPESRWRRVFRSCPSRGRPCRSCEITEIQIILGQAPLCSSRHLVKRMYVFFRVIATAATHDQTRGLRPCDAQTDGGSHRQQRGFPLCKCCARFRPFGKYSAKVLPGSWLGQRA
jgi:hypothetical protein